MATRKRVWIPCTICNGSGIDGQTMVSVHHDGAFGAPGSTTWEQRDAECTNCMGDKGHRMTVSAPDPEPKPIETPDWWG
jgi:hypothetical protein